MTAYSLVSTGLKRQASTPSVIKRHRNQTMGRPDDQGGATLHLNRRAGVSTSTRNLLPDLFSDAQWVALRHELKIPERQLHVARWICRGCTNYEIAAHLGVSLDTVRMHTKSLYKKLKVRARLGVPVRLVLAMTEMNGRATTRA